MSLCLISSEVEIHKYALNDVFMLPVHIPVLT